MFVGSCNGLFRALDAATGKVRWTTRAGPESTKDFFHGDAFISSNLVLIGADGGGAGSVTGHVHAFERDSGRQRWSYVAGPGVWGAIAGHGPSIYAITGAGQLVALNRESGALQWSHPIRVNGWLGPTISGPHVVVGAGDGSLQALDAATGRVDWRADIGAPITTAVAALPQGLYVGTQAGSVARVDARKGEGLSQQKLDPALKPTGTMIETDGALLVLLTDQGENYRALVSWDPADSRMRWRRTQTTGGRPRACSCGSTRRCSAPPQARSSPTARRMANRRGRTR